MKKFSILVLFVVLVFMDNAYAYIDPGTGSMMLQMLIAGILSALFTLKLWVAAAKDFVKRCLGRAEAIEGDTKKEEEGEEHK